MARQALAIVLLLALGLAATDPASATSGWGCFRVVGVANDDALNIRYGPSASAAIVGTIAPRDHGIIALNRPAGGVLDSLQQAVAAEEALCVPADRPVTSRWCQVTHYTGGGTSIGWVSRRFLERSECP
jgi:hypothetical protein